MNNWKKRLITQTRTEYHNSKKIAVVNELKDNIFFFFFEELLYFFS